MMADPPDRTKMSSNSKPRVLIDTVQRHVLADKPRVTILAKMVGSNSSHLPHLHLKIMPMMILHPSDTPSSEWCVCFVICRSFADSRSNHLANI
ncbi:unnamed protein product [Musa hybrid cultivar]